jgi:hypothetical protein
MKTFNVTEGDGKLIVHMTGDDTNYSVSYDHGKLIFAKEDREYIIPESNADDLYFKRPNPNTSNRKFDFVDYRNTYRDTLPSDFGASDITDVDPNSTHFTNEITLGGINDKVPVIAPNGVVIYVNGNVVDSGALVDNGDVIKFELPAAADYDTQESYSVNIGDLSKSFNIITRVGFDGLEASSAFETLDQLVDKGYTGIQTLWTTLGGVVLPFQVQVNFNDGGIPHIGMSFDFSGSVWGDAQVGDSVANGGYNNENMVGTTVTTSSNVGSFKWDGSGSNGNINVGFGTQAGFEIIGKTNWDGNYYNQSYKVHGPYNINYTNPVTNTNFTSEQMSALRNMITDISSKTPYVAWHGDTDGQYPTNPYTTAPHVHGGHTVFIKDANGNWLNMIPRGVAPSNHGVMTLFTRNTFNMYKTTGGTYTGSITVPNGLYTDGLVLPTQFSPMINTGGGIGLGAYYNASVSPKVNNKVVFLVR